MAKMRYARTTLIGGGADALDKIDGAVLNDGDIAQVRTSANILYDYSLDADGGGVESSPWRILPDTNPGTKAWILQGTVNTPAATGFTVAGGTTVKTITVTQDTSLDEAVAMSSKAPKASPTFTELVTTAGQIAFPAVANPSADANTLDDYEEGTWTPTLIGSITPGNHTYGANTSGSYTKIGRLVVLTFVIFLATKGTIDGTITIGGMPFPHAAAAAASRYPSASMRWGNMTTSWVNMIALGDGENTSTISIYGAKVAGVDMAVVDDSDLANTTYFSGSYLYQV